MALNIPNSSNRTLNRGGDDGTSMIVDNGNESNRKTPGRRITTTTTSGQVDDEPHEKNLHNNLNQMPRPRFPTSNVAPLTPSQ